MFEVETTVHQLSDALHRGLPLAGYPLDHLFYVEDKLSSRVDIYGYDAVDMLPVGTKLTLYTDVMLVDGKPYTLTPLER